jgi:hypothetical protein
LCLEHVEHWERIASRGRPAFSSHLINAVLVNMEIQVSEYATTHPSARVHWLVRCKDASRCVILAKIQKT